VQCLITFLLKDKDTIRIDNLGSLMPEYLLTLLTVVLIFFSLFISPTKTLQSTTNLSSSIKKCDYFGGDNQEVILFPGMSQNVKSKEVELLQTIPPFRVDTVMWRRSLEFTNSYGLWINSFPEVEQFPYIYILFELHSQKTILGFSQREMYSDQPIVKNVCVKPYNDLPLNYVFLFD
jgi:hypothetical protein